MTCLILSPFPVPIWHPAAKGLIALARVVASAPKAPTARPATRTAQSAASLPLPFMCSPSVVPSDRANLQESFRHGQTQQQSFQDSPRSVAGTRHFGGGSSLGAEPRYRFNAIPRIAGRPRGEAPRSGKGFSSGSNPASRTACAVRRLGAHPQETKR